MSSTYAGCSQETSRKKMKHLVCLMVLYLISEVGSFDLVIDEIPDVSISRQGLGLPGLLKSRSVGAGLSEGGIGSLLHRSACAP